MESNQKISELKPYLGDNSISKIFKLKSISDKRKDISFGGILEEKMLQKFNIFDIIWYSPKDSEKLENWKAFTNINVRKISDEMEFIQAAQQSYLFNSIIIATGPFAEKTIPLMDEKILEYSIIFIYCKNPDYYKKWSEKYESITSICEHPEQIFENLLKITNLFDMPLFSYEIISTKEFNFNYYDGIYNFELKLNNDYFSLKLDDYEKFCVKTFHHFKLCSEGNKNIFGKFIIDSNIIMKLFNGDNFLVYSEGYIFYKILAFDLYGLNLISLYFSKLPYLFGVLSYEEIETLLKRKEENTYYYEQYRKLSNNLKYLIDILNNKNESILNEIIHLKFIQSFIIIYIKKITKFRYELDNDDFSKYPVVIKYLMDIDFCFRYFFFQIYEYYRDPTYKIKCRNALDKLDRRIPIFYTYCSFKFHKQIALKYASEDEFNKMTDTLIVKNFIVIGNENFHEKIKAIEKEFNDIKLVYLYITQLRNYLVQKNKHSIYRNFSYIFIIDDEDAEKNFKELYSIKDDFALDLLLMVYIRDKDTLINKNNLKNKRNLPIFFVYNTNEILYYINNQKYYNFYRDFIEKNINDFININLLPKIPFDEKDINNKRSIEDSWELADNVPKEIFNEKIITFEGTGHCAGIGSNLFELFRENKIESLFFERYCQYFNFQISPDFLFYKTINVVLKQICYAYSLEENLSFYYIMNRDLRSGDPSKIKKFMSLINAFDKSIKNKLLKSYEGELFRGTKIGVDFLDKKIIPGKILTNLCFWSASKKREKAENFIKNILFIIQAKGKNIDIDSEDISQFDEEEVLFLPYSKFLIKSKEKKNFRGVEIYEVEIEGLENKDERKNLEIVDIKAKEIYQFFA